MEIASSTIPQGFLYYAKRLQGFTRSKIKVFPIGTRANVPMGTTTIVKFPTNSFIDLRSLRSNFDATATITKPTTASATTAVQFPRYTQSLMKTIHYTINGVKFDGTSLNEVNTLYNMFLKCKTGFDFNRQLVYSGWGDEKVTSSGTYYDTKNVTDGSSVNTLTANPKWGTIDDFPLFAGDCQPQIFDTSMGELELQIQWAGAEVMIGDGTNVSGMGYVINNIDFEIDVLQFGSDILDMIVKRKLEMGGEIRIPFYDVIEYTQINKGTNTFQINATSLDKIFVCIRASDYNTVSATGVSTGDTNSKFFKYSSMVDATNSTTTTDQQTTITNFLSNNYTWQFRINGKNYPEYGAVPLIKSYDHIVNCFSDLSDVNATNILCCKGNAIPTYTEAIQYYSHNNFIFGVDFTPPSTSFEGARTLAGLNTGGLSMPIDLILTGVRTDVYVSVFFVVHKILSFSMATGMRIEN